MRTGKFFLKKRILGGYNLMVEHEYYDGTDAVDMKKYREFRKATEEEIQILSAYSVGILKEF